MGGQLGVGRAVSETAPGVVKDLAIDDSNTIWRSAEMCLRQDRLDLAGRVRSDSVTRHIPVLVIFSRTAKQHRDLAEQLGVNTFLGKPYPDRELPGQIAEPHAPGSRAAAA